MNVTWAVPAFTPAKFALLALTAVAITLGVSAPQQRAVSVEHVPTLRPIDYVGTDFGTLTDTVFLIPTQPTPVPGHGSTSTRPPAPIVHRPYPPLVR